VVRKLRLVVGGLAALAAFLLVTAMACDGGEGEITPSATPTPETAEVQEQLRQMVLQLKDLPSGVILAEEFFVTAEESSIEAADREARLAKLEEWGYILGYDATYQANPEALSQTGLILATSTASLYGSEEGAEASFADAVETARTTDWSDLFGGAQEVQVEEVASPALTDEMLWLRITAEAAPEVGIGEETFVQDVILFRQGPARASLMIAWATDDGSSAFIEQLAKAQAQNLKDALP
jgi:hypothetical protein